MIVKIHRVCFSKYYRGGVCHCLTRLDGQVIVITGANSGIGKALAFEVAKRSKHCLISIKLCIYNWISGGTLILACRDVKKGLDTKVELIQQLQISHNKVHVRYLDLCNIASIVKFSKDIHEEFPELYALINNAGVFYHPQGLTDDGFEITLQTNYLGRKTKFIYFRYGNF